jgi:alcohol dehydrogenase
VKGASASDGGEILVHTLVEAMRTTGVPLGLRPLGYGDADVEALSRGALMQKRLVDNAPLVVDDDGMRDLFRQAMSYP